MEQGSTSSLRSFSAVEEAEAQQGEVTCAGTAPWHWDRVGLQTTFLTPWLVLAALPPPLLLSGVHLVGP